MMGTDVEIDESDGKHLWSEILRTVQSNNARKQQSSKNVLLLGETNCGKSALIARLQGLEDPLAAVLQARATTGNDQNPKDQSVRPPQSGCALEYQALDVKDEYRETTTRLNIWTLDGDPLHSDLLRFSLHSGAPSSVPEVLNGSSAASKKESTARPEGNLGEAAALTLENSVAVVVVSMQKPWLFVETVSHWLELLERHISRLKIPAERLEQLKRKVAQRFASYSEPERSMKQSKSGALSASMTSSDSGVSGLQSAASAQAPPLDAVDAHSSMPADGPVLSHNLGIPVLVVVTKTDAIPWLEKDLQYKEEHFDFIQIHLRRLGLHYGAGLVYCSVKEDKNCDLLHKYLLHLLYSFPFTHAAHVVEKELLFIPIGWDNEKKISIVVENMQLTSQLKADSSIAYNDVIVRQGGGGSGQLGTPRKSAAGGGSARGAAAAAGGAPELAIEDDQAFLLRQLTQMNKLQAVQGAGGAQSGVGAVSAPAPTGGALSASLTAKQEFGEGPGQSTFASSVYCTPARISKPVSTSKLEQASALRLGAGGVAGAPGNETVLASFFNSLLTKRPPGSGPGSNVARDLSASDLERAARTSAGETENAPAQPQHTDSSAT